MDQEQGVLLIMSLTLGQEGQDCRVADGDS